MHSNCLLEALKAVVRNPRQNKIYIRGSWLEVLQCRWPHFYWYHKPHDKYYCLEPKYPHASFLEQLWYEGEIIEFKWHEYKEEDKMCIVFKNGDVKNYSKDQYTDYKYCGEVFAVIKNGQWIGIYSMDMVRYIEVEV